MGIGRGNLGLYGYCANNPVRYVDPNGKFVAEIRSSELVKALEYLYEHSTTFKEQFNILLSPTNGLYQKMIVIFTTHQDRFAGNTQTNDSPISEPVIIMRLNRRGGIIKTEECPSEKEVQAIFINIDLSRIHSKGLNLYEILAEEVSHAADCASYGAESWNNKCRNEDAHYSYYEKPREIYAKELAKKILKEINNEN